MKTRLWVIFLALAGLAQDPKLNETSPIPLDPSVRIGKLDNGLTYYIKTNHKPENKLELRLAVNAGSILEDDDQRGLAHFVEHMAFNGSKHFEKNELVSYLQSIGVEFGADLNAFTSFDQTVYMLPIPTESNEIVEKGFQVLEDWAHNLTFDHSEIDKERGVVIEEWRLNRGAEQRMSDAYLPVMLKGSRYAERLPIGSKEIIEGADYETFKRFYRDWYRPDLMAVVAVGDMDADAIEAKIKAHFSGIEMPATVRKRENYAGPLLNETRIAIETDPEAAYTMVQIGYLHDRAEIRTVGDYRKVLLTRLWSTMVSNRLDEIRRSAEPPFAFGSASYGGSWVKTQAAYSMFAMAAEGQAMEAAKVLLKETARVKKHGFLTSELERAKRELLEQYERARKEKDKTNSDRLVWRFIGHYLDESPAPGPEFNERFAQDTLPTVTLADVNKLIDTWLKSDNRYVVITGPEKEGLVYPSKEEIRKVLDATDQEDVSAYQDSLTATTLMDSIPEKGSITETKTLDAIGVTELLLANGMRVILKPTDFKDNEVVVSARSKGGMSLYSDEDFFQTRSLGSVISGSGFADLSQTDIEKILAGKTVYVSPYVGGTSEGMGGGSAADDIESLFQLIHLAFTAPRKDETAFKSTIHRQKAMMENQRSEPMMFFYDQVSRESSNHHPRSGWLLDDADWEKLDHDEMMRVYRERFADPGDFTFVFVGSFDNKQMLPLIETYLASLQGKNSNEAYKDIGVRSPKGVIKKTVKKGVDPKSMVNLIYTTPATFSHQDDYHIEALCSVLTIKLIEILREEMSGVYGVGARGGMSRGPNEQAKITISFPCAPENVESLSAAMTKIIETIKAEGPSQEDVDKVKETQRLDLNEAIKTNRFWSSHLSRSYFWGDDPVMVLKAEERIEALSRDDLKATAERFFKMENVLQMVLYPEDWPEPKSAKASH